MADLHFDFEWIDPLGARGAELRATWARLRIDVNGQPVTKVFDRQAKGVRESVYLPLYPMAEWIASNWWFLLAEVETPGKHSMEDYFRRHSIKFGQEGFALPNLMFQPVGSEILLKWAPVASTYANIEFLGEGAQYVNKESVAQSLTNFVEALLSRLDDLDVARTPLSEEWEVIRAADPEEQEFCLAAAALGEDPYSLNEDQSKHLIQVSQTLRPGVLPELLNTSTLDSLADQAEAIDRAITDAVSHDDKLRRLTDMRHALSTKTVSEKRPWEHGYEMAARVRAELGLNGTRLNNNDEVERALGFGPDELWTAIAGVSAARVEGLVAVSDDELPGIALAKRGDEALRFSFARALCEYLLASLGEVHLVTRAHSDRQKTNRAFAAEFLVPASALRNMVEGDVLGSDEVDDLSAAFGVSSFVIKHQLENHSIAGVYLT